jgi:hypothetical protein
MGARKPEDINKLDSNRRIIHSVSEKLPCIILLMDLLAEVKLYMANLLLEELGK